MARKASLHQTLRWRLQSEVALRPCNWGGRLRMVLAYPNTYAVGMGNLGLQTLYRLLNAHPEVCCERAFLPDPAEIALHRRRGTPLLCLETQRPVAEADVLALSVSFENDYPNILTLLELAGLPLRARRRDARHPLVVMGGAAVSINPEPVADFVDLCCVGEGEGLVAPLTEALLEHPGREDLLAHLCRLPGFYVPALYHPIYADDADGAPPFLRLEPEPPAPPRVAKVRASFGGPDSVAASAILSPEIEFGDRAMIEVARGCTKGCRYCWVGYNVSPFRVHAVDDILEVASRWRPHTDRIGLVATALLDHPEIEAIAEGLRGSGFGVFSPSLIISTLREPLLRAVTASGQRSVTIAPETGSDRLRELVMKRVSNSEILDKVGMIFRAGAHDLKCYIIVGLPGETDADLEELVDLATEMRAVMLRECRSRGRLGKITLSVNCLIPKPGTPFQWAEQIPIRTYRAKLAWLRRRIGPLPNLELEAMAPRAAEMQGLLSRGDRRVGELLEHLLAHRSWGRAVRAWQQEGGSPEHFVYRAYDPSDPLPWGHLGTSAARPALRRQWSLAHEAGDGEAA